VRAVLIGMKLDEEQFLAAARSGVTGYLLKDASASDVIAAVRAVFRGEADGCPWRGRTHGMQGRRHLPLYIFLSIVRQC
jgi:DNA-binding NarL/FixJ family response regulator